MFSFLSFLGRGAVSPDSDNSKNSKKISAEKSKFVGSPLFNVLLMVTLMLGVSAFFRVSEWRRLNAQTQIQIKDSETLADGDNAKNKMVRQPADIFGGDVTYKIAVPGKHIAMNSLAVLAASSLAGADLALSALALAQIKPASGRGVRETLVVASGTATLIDESYNANPASMAAALTVLGQAKVGSRGRRIAVLGDMLELGHSGPALHRGLTEAIAANKIDTVFCCGPLMQHLWEALPSAQKGGYADQSAALESQVVAALGAGDVIMIKGSLGSRMKLIVTALQTRFPGKAALDDAIV